MPEVKMDLNPEISVVMSVYKEPIEWIRKSVDSILNQSFIDFEFIIVNDAPGREDLSDYLKFLSDSDSRIKVIENNVNSGLTKSLNNGLKQCRGKYIVRMDADDFSLPQRFERQISFMENNPDVIASSAMAVEWDGVRTGEKLYRPVTDSDFQEYIFTSSPFIHPLLIVRKDVLDKYRLTYDETFKVSQDYKLAADLSKIGRLANLDEVLLYYRVSENQISKARGKEQDENGRRIRRDLINTFYSTLGIPEIGNKITLDDIAENERSSRNLDPAQRRIMNCIRRLFYYSLSDYSLKSLSKFIMSGDYFSQPYNLRRFGVVVVKHLRRNVVPSLV